MSTLTTGEIDRLAPVLAISERFRLKSNENRVWFYALNLYVFH